jgi:hypothetical protein
VSFRDGHVVGDQVNSEPADARAMLREFDKVAA